VHNIELKEFIGGQEREVVGKLIEEGKDCLVKKVIAISE
jgi:hypothetical protein